MTEERRKELMALWLSETSEDWTQEWRDELTADEQTEVEQWDYGFLNGIARMIQDSREE